MFDGQFINVTDVADVTDLAVIDKPIQLSYVTTKYRLHKPIVILPNTREFELEFLDCKAAASSTHLSITDLSTSFLNELLINDLTMSFLNELMF